MNSVYARIHCGTYERNACCRSLTADDEKAGHGKCSHCNKDLYFTSPQYGEVIGLACSRECELAMDWHTSSFKIIPPVEKSPVVMPYIDKIKKPKKEKVALQDKPKRDNCPECDGPPYRRGWRHTDECPNSTANKLAKAKADTAERRKKRNEK